MQIFPKRWGEYPPEYDREVHGPYNPSVYYGKRDTPFSQVKLGELPAWLGRRNKSPSAMAQACSRAWFGYNINWINVTKPSAAFLYQMAAGITIFFYILDYKKFTSKRNYRYH